jgi:peptidyl-dipeptidase A
MKKRILVATLLLSAACDPNARKPTTAGTEKPVSTGLPTAGKASPQDAKAFVEKVNKDLFRLWADQARADWIKETYITDDTEAQAAHAYEAVMAYTSQAIKDSTRFAGMKLDPDTDRMLYLLRVSQTLPAPNDEAKRAELASISEKMTGMYGKGKYCRGEGKDQKCRDLEQLSDVLKKSRDWNEQLDAWIGWHSISPQMKPMFMRYVELGNEGAREIGFKDLGELWKAGYDMSGEEFERETDRLWSQVKPLYDSLHCYVRAKLSEKYGADKVPPDGVIPAHVLGNMWAQEWDNIYPLLEPYKGESDLDVTKALQAKKYEPKDMIKLGEAFFTSLGFDPLPPTFWERSMLTKPKDREVVCHASAWDVGYNNDLRIKMCIKIDEEDLITIHHELGHDFYFHQYYTLPVLYQAGANDGFHEGIGDTLALSVTPGYLKELGILSSVPKSDKGLINLQLHRALARVAFLPFGKLIDQWRWDVFSGKTPPERYNAAWWELRRKYQGVGEPIARSESDFDPGAKYHVPANVPYTRYFLAAILQFQFHRALCKVAGHTGPLHECSIYGNKAAGDRLKTMLSLGASKPWPEALKAISGETQMDATAILDYFAPLSAWLEKQNAGKKCGW